MHRPTLLLALATVALGASANIHSESHSDVAPGVLTTGSQNFIAARGVDVEALKIVHVKDHHIGSDSTVPRKLITVNLSRRNVNVDAPLLNGQRKLITVDLNRRLDVQAHDVPLLEEQRKLITVDLKRRLDVQAHDVPLLTEQHKLITVDLSRRSDVLAHGVPLLKEQRKTITVNLNRRLDVQAHNVPLLKEQRKPITVTLSRRNYRMSTGYLREDPSTMQMDGPGMMIPQEQNVAQMSRRNIHAKVADTKVHADSKDLKSVKVDAAIQNKVLSRRNHDFEDDEEDIDEDENESDSQIEHNLVANGATTNDTKDGSKNTSDSSSTAATDSGAATTTDKKHSAASRTSSIMTGLSAVSVVVGSLLLLV
ncbi:hypothetical protein BGZ98_010238 [Dissophora globulifera]|nr:hypothetical protein BGZ98_010238 [Dissophora globulifera]